MLTVGLTGGIATGKSIVAELLRQKGCYVENADLIAHQLMLPGGEIYQALINHFGEKLLASNRSINRQQLAEIVFRQEEERTFLNDLTHPLILNKVKQTVDSLERTGGYEIYVTEAALILEAGYQSFYDRLVLTFCRPEIQAERLIQRQGLSPEEAWRKIKSQWPDEQKIPLADYLIDTSGQLAETVEQTEALYLRLYQDAQLKKIEKLIKDTD
ncbi:MAG: dephospho-CoA kinase [Acidobacteriota bacterium]|nr:dephospho-CoA kinase [Acidobacteriota bacterium]